MNSNNNFPEFPSNILIMDTHGSREFPHFVKQYIHKDFNDILIRNYSDYGTRFLTKDIPSNHLVYPKYSRLIGDPNRDPNASDFIRTEDFGGNQIWTDKFELELKNKQDYWKNRFAQLSVMPYLEQIFKHIEFLLTFPENKNKPIILIDLHDTSNRILEKRGSHKRSQFTMPTAIISNGENSTSPDFMIEIFQKILLKSFYETDEKQVLINEIYLGGHITRFFGDPHNDKIKLLNKNSNKIYTIQLELDRDLYLRPSTQKTWFNSKINEENSISEIRKSFNSAIKNFGIKINEKL